MRNFSFIATVFLFTITLFSFQQAKAQFDFVVTQATSDDEVVAWVDTIFLAGVDPQSFSSIEFHGDFKSVGRFTGGFFLGFTTPEGIIMTTGYAEFADKANECNSNQNATKNNNGVDGDQDLEQLTNFQYDGYDACIIEFNFKPTADTVRFNYVFGSEEYHDYALNGFNDVFGFFLSENNGDSLGPFLNNAKNIAIIPGTTLPVSINNINYGQGSSSFTVCNGNPGGCNHCIYLRDNSIYNPNPNSVFQQFVYDAYTSKLVAKSAVKQCNWYHIKLAVGDMGDGNYDTGVLLEKGSFNPGTVVEETEFDHPTIDSLLYESCNNHIAVLYFRIAEPVGFPYTFPFEIGGDATRGTDYELYTTCVTHSDSVFIPVGATYDSIIIRPFSDTDAEGTEEVRVIFSPQMCSSFATSKDTSIVLISDNPPFPDTTRYYFTKCEDTLYLTFNDIAGGVSPYRYDWFENNSSDPALQYIITGSDSVMVPCLMYDTCGYQSYNEAYVLVPDVQVTAGPDKEMCNDPSVTLEGASDEAQHFHWTANPADPSLSGQESIPQPTVSPTLTTEYILKASDNCTHTEHDTTMVLMNGAVATASSDKNEICLGDSVVITVNNAATYKWTPSPPDPSLGSQDTSQTIVVYPTQNTTYSVHIVNDCGYDADDNVSIIVNPLPNANAGIDGEVCKGLTFQLQASGGTEYKWSSDPFDSSLFTDGQDTLPNPTVTPDAQTEYTYIVMVTDNHGCVAEDSMKLFVKPVPAVDVTSSDDTICYGSQISLDAIGTDIIPTWSSEPYDPDVESQKNNLTITVSPDTTTTYTLSAVATGFDCPATIKKTVHVIPQLFATFQTEGPKVCQNTPYQVVYSGNATSNANYVWGFEDGEINTGSGAGPIDLQWPTTGTKIITLTVEESGCNSNMEQQTVEVLPTPITGFTATPVEGCEPLEVKFTDTSSNTSGYVSWEWNFGSQGSSELQSPSFTFDQEGDYTVSLQVTSDGNCKSSIERTAFIKVFDSPTSGFEANPEETVLDEATIDFTNLSTSVDGLSYEWDFNDGNTSTDKDPKHTYEATGAYEVSLTVITNHECEDTYLYEITVHPDFAVFMPNAFTPNGDGLNDTFKVKGIGVKKYLLQIFSRWGKMIYESTNLEDEWDAADVPGGTYIYVIHATTLLDKPIEERGSVTVVK